MQTNHTEAVLETLLRAIAMSSLPQKGKDDIVVFFSSAGIQRLTDVIPFGLDGRQDMGYIEALGGGKLNYNGLIRMKAGIRDIVEAE